MGQNEARGVVPSMDWLMKAGKGDVPRVGSKSDMVPPAVMQCS